ncbi:MAG TPA: divalent-cation tolerance protein CutA [Syntrophorhabdaceae bacterium]|jgi:periplasmic divalent cation tolerance protein
MEEIIQITFTAAARETAETIGRRLVGERLAACAQINGPIQSIYWWKGNLEEAEEWLCVLKSRRSHYDRIEGVIKKLHPYELPEITATMIDNALPGYRAWVIEETAPPDGSLC